MSDDDAWLHGLMTAARPQVMAALTRTFRDFDLAEEAYQEACLRALRTWPAKGPPRDAAGWLVMVARNAGIDVVRRTRRHVELADERTGADLGDVEAEVADRLDGADYRDDILRLMFVCCHPDLPATQQIALALRIVSGLSVSQIARAFLVSDTRQGADRADPRLVRDAGSRRAGRATRGGGGDALPPLQRGLHDERRRARPPGAALHRGDPARAPPP